MNELDFSGKGVLVVGGSSGIGNGVAHAFLERGAAVHVWGTRATAEDYADVEGSDLDGLAYALYGYTYAFGSNQLMGLWNIYVNSTLKQTSSGHYAVASCS